MFRDYDGKIDWVATVLISFLAVLVFLAIGVIVECAILEPHRLAAMHHHTPFTIDVLVGTTAGCEVHKLTSFTADGYCSDKVYVTNCHSVCWDESHGKTTTRVCNPSN